MAFTPERSDAIRAELIAVVRPATKRRRTIAGAGLVLVGVLLGLGGSAAFAASGWTSVPATPAGQPVPAAPVGEPTAPSVVPVEAPPGHIPGAPIISVLGSPTGQKITAATEVPLADRPAEATHVRVTITCLTAGTFWWGPDAGGNNPSVSCAASESGSETAWYDFALDPTVDKLYVSPPEGGEAAVSVQYLTYLPTRFGVNENGQTYGTGAEDATPDLILVIGTSPDGGEVEGYALATDLVAFSPDHPDHPANPEEALRWQQERDEKYPGGWDIPVYQSDGVTRIGTFHVG